MWQGRLSSKFATPESEPPTKKCRRLLIPEDPGFLQLVSGALAELLIPDNYTETAGGVSIERTTQLFQEMFSGYTEDCEPSVTMPVGAIIPHMIAGALPANWLNCNGAQYNAEDYPELYAALPANLKQEETFNVPDLRERVPVGANTALGGYNIAPGGHGGDQTGWLNAGDIPNHSHSINALAVQPGPGSFPARANLASWTGGASTVALHANTNPLNSVSVSLPEIIIPLHSTNPMGGGDLTGHNNLQPFTICYYAIVARP